MSGFASSIESHVFSTPPTSDKIEVVSDGRGWEQIVKDYVPVMGATMVPSAVSRGYGVDDYSGLQMNGFDPNKPMKQYIMNNEGAATHIYDPETGEVEPITSQDVTALFSRHSKKAQDKNQDEAQDKAPDQGTGQTSSQTLSQAPTQASSQLRETAEQAIRVNPTKSLNINKIRPKQSGPGSVPPPEVEVLFEVPGLGNIPFKFHEVMVDPDRDLVVLMVNRNCPGVNVPEFSYGEDASYIHLHIRSKGETISLVCEYFNWTYKTLSGMEHIILRLVSEVD